MAGQRHAGQPNVNEKRTALARAVYMWPFELGSSLRDARYRFALAAIGHKAKTEKPRIIIAQADGSGTAAVTSTVPSFGELASSKPSGLLMPKNKKSGPGSVVKMPPRRTAWRCR